MKQWVQVTPLEALKDGAGKDFKVQGKDIALFWIDQQCYALENACYHQGAPIHDGEVKDCIVTCPWHSWKFNLKTGECTRDDSLIMKTYKTKIEDNAIWILI